MEEEKTTKQEKKHSRAVSHDLRRQEKGKMVYNGNDIMLEELKKKPGDSGEGGKYLRGFIPWKKKGNNEEEDISIELQEEKMPLVEEEDEVMDFHLALGGLKDGVDSAGNVLPSHKKISRLFFAFCVMLFILNVVGEISLLQRTQDFFTR